MNNIIDDSMQTGDAAPEDAAGQRAAVSIRGMSKAFPGSLALDGVDLEIAPGEVHALCGGNGSGKSTLIKILTGIIPGDEGSVQIGSAQLDVSELNPQLVHGLGVRVVHQDLAVFPDLSVTENMMLGAEFPKTLGGGIDWKTATRRTQELIERFEIDARGSDLLRSLPVAVRAQVAIARALQDVSDGNGLIILDEPTASLPVHEARMLHTAIRRLAQTGHSVLFVSHRLDEVLALADTVTVFKDGRVSSVSKAADLTEAKIIEAILGREMQTARVRPLIPEDAPTVLEVRGLGAGPLQDVDLTVKAGETVGVAGLLGSGRTELLRAICGDLARTSGRVVVNGQDATFKHLEEAIGRGIVMIPEDRVNGGAFADMTLGENMDIGVLNWYWKNLRFQKSKMNKDAETLRRDFKVKAESGSTMMRALSGGNQQKAIFARWLRRDPTLVLLDEPTQGVDVGARSDLYAAVTKVTDAGGAAVVVTSDLEELAQIVDRAIVLRDGRVVAEVVGEELNAHRISELIYRDR